jgi:hypothetical protein
MSMLLGSQATTSLYLATDRQSKGSLQAANKEEAEFLAKLSTTLKRDSTPEHAEQLFSAWNESHRGTYSEASAYDIVNTVFAAALSPAKGGELAKLSGPYARAIISQLLDQRVIVDSMWKGGVVGAGLLACADWVRPFLRPTILG